LIGAVVDGRWRIGERLGQGGMGTVYRGERLKLGKRVALKFLDPRYAQSKAALARFDREARAISRLQHAHCVSIIDFGVHEGLPYIVMEYVAGKPLSQLMGKKELTPQRAVRIMRQMLDALRHAHAHGVVHRDLKPDNVMLAEVTGTEDYVKILDFGLARIISVDEPSISIPAMVAGTPSWMSPEQALGHKVDHRSDLFSAGSMLYAMCTARRPFRSDDTVEIIRLVREAAPIPPRKIVPALSEALERVIAKAMARAPDDRYFTAADFLAALDRTPEAKAHTRPLSSGRARAPRLVAALLLLGAAGGAAYHFRSALTRREAPPAPVPLVRTVAPSPVLRVAAPVIVAPPIVSATPAPSLEAAPTPTPAPAVAVAPTAPTAPTPAPAAAPKPQLSEPALRAILQQDPRAAWAELALGNVYFQRLWRADAVKAWEEALRLDPDLRHDRQLGEHLCVALGAKWQGGGARILTSRLAEEIVPTLERCLASVDDYPRLQVVARLLERFGGRERVDHGLVALRTLALAPACDERKSALRTLVRLHDPRAAGALELLRADACLLPEIPPALAKLR
jgi:eukaryotic-like serine/threonine-protein kinase